MGKWKWKWRPEKGLADWCTISATEAPTKCEKLSAACNKNAECAVLNVTRQLQGLGMELAASTYIQDLCTMLKGGYGLWAICEARRLIEEIPVEIVMKLGRLLLHENWAVQLTRLVSL